MECVGVPEVSDTRNASPKTAGRRISGVVTSTEGAFIPEEEEKEVEDAADLSRNAPLPPLRRWTPATEATRSNNCTVRSEGVERPSLQVIAEESKAARSMPSATAEEERVDSALTALKDLQTDEADICARRVVSSIVSKVVQECVTPLKDPSGPSDASTPPTSIRLSQMNPVPLYELSNWDVIHDVCKHWTSACSAEERREGIYVGINTFEVHRSGSCARKGRPTVALSSERWRDELKMLSHQQPKLCASLLSTDKGRCTHDVKVGKERLFCVFWGIDSVEYPGDMGDPRAMLLPQILCGIIFPHPYLYVYVQLKSLPEVEPERENRDALDADGSGSQSDDSRDSESEADTEEGVEANLEPDRRRQYAPVDTEKENVAANGSAVPPGEFPESNASDYVLVSPPREDEVGVVV